MTFFDAIFGLLTLFLGVLGTIWCGFWGALMGPVFPHVVQVWVHLLHEGIVRPLLCVRTEIVDSPALAYLRSHDRRGAVIFGTHYSTVFTPSGEHALFSVNGGRHVVHVVKEDFLRLWFWVRLGPVRLPFPNLALPFFGVAGVRSGAGLFIDRDGAWRAKRKIRERVKKVLENSDLLLLPEGTRFLPSKLNQPRHISDGCKHTLRYSSGGLWNIIEEAPPHEALQRYFAFRFASSKPDHGLRSILHVRGSTLFFEIVEVTRELSELHDQKGLERWLKRERKRADDFIEAHRE